MRRTLVLSIIATLFLAACSPVHIMDSLIGYAIVPESVVIEGVQYRTGFYGDLYPVFGQVGDIGSETLQDEIVLEEGVRKFRRVDFKDHDWVHSHIGGSTEGVVYCAESEWEAARDYYADPSSFDYYCGTGHFIIEDSHLIIRGVSASIKRAKMATLAKQHVCCLCMKGSCWCCFIMTADAITVESRK